MRNDCLVQVVVINEINLMGYLEPRASMRAGRRMNIFDDEWYDDYTIYAVVPKLRIGGLIDALTRCGLVPGMADFFKQLCRHERFECQKSDEMMTTMMLMMMKMAMLRPDNRSRNAPNSTWEDANDP